MFSAFPLLLAIPALLGIAAIYIGGAGITRMHRISAVAGSVLVLCTVFFPVILVVAFGSMGGTSSPYDPLFTSYFLASTLSLVITTSSLARLVWLRFKTS